MSSQKEEEKRNKTTKKKKKKKKLEEKGAWDRRLTDGEDPGATNVTWEQGRRRYRSEGNRGPLRSPSIRAIQAPKAGELVKRRDRLGERAKGICLVSRTSGARVDGS